MYPVNPSWGIAGICSRTNYLKYILDPNILICNKYLNINYHAYIGDIQIYVVLKEPINDISILKNLLGDIFI